MKSMVLEYLCKSVVTSLNDNDDSKDEREQALLDVIQAAGLQAFDLKRLLKLARQAQFWRVCEIIYAETNEYDLILECYLNDRRRRLDLFHYIRTLWPALDERERNKFHMKIMENFIQIIETDSFKAFKLFCIFFQMDLGKVLKLIGKNETAQYGILKSCFAYSDDTKSSSSSSSTSSSAIIHIDPSHYLHYIDLLARYEPSQLLSFLKNKSEYYREQDVLDIIRKYQSPLLIPSIAYLLERLGQYTETFDLLLESMHEWKTIEQLYQMALDCVHFCQRTTIKLKDKKEREDLWLKFLQKILEISSKSFDCEQSGAFRRIYGEVLNSMIGYVTLPSILELIMGTDAADITKGIRKRSDTNTRSTFEIRQLIQSMLENCSFELRLLETTRRLLQRDLNDDIQQMCSIMNHSVPIRLNQCTYCQKLLHQQQDIDKKYEQKNKFIIFACRHVFHLHCLMEIQTEQSNNNFCPQCTTRQSSAAAAATTTTTTTTTSIVRPEMRRLTTIHSDQNEKQIALSNIQQQVVTAMLERKRLNAHHLNIDDNDERIQTSINEPYSSSTPLQLPDKWREYLSSSE
ncbi:unnamed protein product [Rotaria sp. Silwood2]|nr:unnamed protein product [Rotaria sp. Silwood2]CAF2704123.1 unnamed protein product [Rotaria sp. Silwood2]CAF2968434.1 unnamed protein product [Rotaria sp. Silwood2]CAF3124098.1 unnamed protein product [Rotaria sp. Silwood2]CAF3865103.1 unnamed protein product [Rotaria sp. Silwood2]